MPVATPSGTAKNAVTSITRQVPTQAERIPACAGRRDGKLVRNSQFRRGMPSIAMSANSAVNVSTPTISAAKPHSAKT